MYKNKILLIAGGTVSFENAVLEQFSNTDIGKIRFRLVLAAYSQAI